MQETQGLPIDPSAVKHVFLNVYREYRKHPAEELTKRHIFNFPAVTTFIEFAEEYERHNGLKFLTEDNEIEPRAANHLMDFYAPLYNHRDRAVAAPEPAPEAQPVTYVPEPQPQHAPAPEPKPEPTDFKPLDTDALPRVSATHPQIVKPAPQPTPAIKQHAPITWTSGNN